LLDLSKANDERLRQAADFAWAIKELIYDLSDKGHAELERRLARSLHGGLSARPAEALAGLLSADVIRALQAKWFPNLAAEVAQHRAGRTITTAGQTNAGPALAVAANLKPEEWVLRGGWYRSDLEFSLSYRPVGHPDPFLQSWLELTGAVPEGQKVFDFLSAPHVPGLCIKCHSVDGPQPLRVNWRGFRPDAFDHPFTRFSHTAHFSLLDDRGCQTCHQLDRELSADTYAASFARSQRDPAVFRSSFRFIELAACTACHTKKYASESCLECHNYHVGHFIPTLPRQQWPRADSKLNP
jgi:hypothetical protein